MSIAKELSYAHKDLGWRRESFTESGFYEYHRTRKGIKYQYFRWLGAKQLRAQPKDGKWVLELSAKDANEKYGWSGRYFGPIFDTAMAAMIWVNMNESELMGDE